MTDKTYFYIWAKIILPTINKIESEIDAENKKKYLFECENLNLLKKEISDLYNKKKNRLKELYHYDDGSAGRKIDIHKIAACFASAIAELQVFKYNLEIDENLPDSIFLSNAKLAYRVSLGIIYINLIHHYAILGEKEILNKLLDSGVIITPPTTKGHDEYNIGREKTICLNTVFSNEFDILTYSDMMFWIEYYNRQVLENTITPTPFIDEDAFDA